MAPATIVETFWQRVKETPDRGAIMHKVDGAYKTVSWRQHGKTVELVAAGLLKQGIMPQDKVAICAHTRPHWTWADMSILSIGAVTVPVYPTLVSPEVHYLVQHSEATAIFAENAKQADKILAADPLPAALQFVVVMDGEPAESKGKIRCLSWQDLLADGEAYLAQGASKLLERRQALQPGDLASIVYTSGTTGVPKGAMLTHGNFYAVCEAMHKMVGLHPDDVDLSFLPLSHVYERVGGQFLAIFEGLLFAYAESIETVPKNLMEVRPTVLNGVPRFYEKAYQKIQAEIRHLPQAQQFLIRWALSLAKRAAKWQDKAAETPALLDQFYRGELRIADHLVFSRIRQRFGGRLRLMVSGAAPLARDIQCFFDTIGLNMVEGYGLTETAAPISCNTPEHNKIGSVGKLLPGVAVKIAQDGEILVRGPNLFAGYYKDPEATAAVLVDGWFATGDIGEIDKDGYLFIKDRKKDLIITAGGKHVAPQFIENMYKGDALISHILVYGDRRKFISALITLNQDGLRSFARTHQIAYEKIAELTHNESVRREIEALVSRRNQELANFERIKKFTVLDHDFSAENNELTPTFKVKRKLVTEKYKHILDHMYDAEDLELEGEADN